MRLSAVLREKQALAESVVRHPREGGSGALSLRSSTGKMLKDIFLETKHLSHMTICAHSP